MRVMVGMLACALALSACTSDLHIRMLENEGKVRVEKASRPDADYIVSIQNYWDIGYEPDDKATRDTIVARYMAAQCPSGKIVGEDVIETGQALIGRKMRTYQIKVKC